jgi:hypothetical protein
MKKLENILIAKHNLDTCTITDSGTGRLDVVVEPDLSEDEQILVEETIDEYMGGDWEGFAIVYNVNENIPINNFK